MRGDEFGTPDEGLTIGKTRRHILKALGAGAAGLLALLRWGSAPTEGRYRAGRPSVSAQGKSIPNSANSITSVEGGIRPDPEGVAPAASVKLLTWNDARNAARTATLGAYLYQYDFSFDDG